jgi:IS1 family transposase
MNILSREKQIEIIAALTEGMSIRAVERLTGVHRDTIMRLGARVGRGCAELHDRMFVGIRTGRIELDELWAYVGKRRRWHQEPGADGPVTGDMFTFIALASSARAIIAYRAGKRTSETTDLFVHDLRERVLGVPEFSTDGYYPYTETIRHAFGGRAPHGVIVKNYNAKEITTAEAARRYSPAAVVSVSRAVVNGAPMHISTSYVERQNLTVRMSSRRFTRLTNGFSKKLENHAAAVSLYVAHYNLCRCHETIRSTPAEALGLTDHAWSIGELLDAALAVTASDPTETAPDRRRRFRVIDGSRK